jgi:hypothetical protein
MKSLKRKLSAKSIRSDAPSTTKKVKNAKRESFDQVESVDCHGQLSLGEIDEWGWNEVELPSYTAEGEGEDFSGVLCLEELRGVEIDTIGDDIAGKQFVFKVKYHILFWLDAKLFHVNIFNHSSLSHRKQRILKRII